MVELFEPRTCYEDSILATGFGGYLALPILRKKWRPDLEEGEARCVHLDCSSQCTRPFAAIATHKIFLTTVSVCPAGFRPRKLSTAAIDLSVRREPLIVGRSYFVSICLIPRATVVGHRVGAACFGFFSMASYWVKPTCNSLNVGMTGQLMVALSLSRFSHRGRVHESLCYSCVCALVLISRVEYVSRGEFPIQTVDWLGSVSHPGQFKIKDK